MARLILPSVGLLLVAIGVADAAQRAASNPAAACAPTGAVVRMPDLAEASGIAASRRTPGRLWTHNDSGDPVLVALDQKGGIAGRVKVAGVRVEDWEAIAVGPCQRGSCIYMADIGDNNAARKHITIHRLPEPVGMPESVAVTESFYATYPDGPHDAETFLVAPDGALFIVTKGDGDGGRIAAYRFPNDLRPSTFHKLVMVGKPRHVRASRDLITDGSVSLDGLWVALRSNTSLTIHRTTDFLAGNWMNPKRIDLTPAREPQGEGVTFGNDNVVYLVGEGGRAGKGGTFTSFVCPLAP
jgi:hypothetical protein